MSPPADEPRDRAPRRPVPLGRVLHRNQQVKESIAEAADDLTAVNEVLQQAEGDAVEPQAVRDAIDQNAAVEATVTQAAADLTEINAALAREVSLRTAMKGELAEVKQELGEVRDHLSDVEAREAEVRRLSLHDPLTGLATRALFEENLEHGMAMARRHGYGLAVLFIDIDQFKGINDQYGHAVGDAVLRRVATCLGACVREGDTVSRWGGDEFICLLLEITDAADAVRVAESMSAKLTESCDMGGTVLSISASIGVAIYPEDGDTALALFRNADRAMYDAKRSDKSVILFRDCCDDK